jgi:hypothetical protein
MCHTIAVRTMRIQFSSGVSSGDIYFGQVTNTLMKGLWVSMRMTAWEGKRRRTGDLNVIWGLYKVRASNGTIRDKTRSIARLSSINEQRA